MQPTDTAGGDDDWWSLPDLSHRLEYLRHHSALLLQHSGGTGAALALLHLHRTPGLARALVLLQLLTAGGEQRGQLLEEALTCLGR